MNMVSFFFTRSVAHKKFLLDSMNISSPSSIHSITLHFRLQNFRYQGSVSALLYAQPLKGLRSKNATPICEWNVHVFLFVVLLFYYPPFSFLPDGRMLLNRWEAGGLRGPQGKISVLQEDDDAGPLFFYFLLLPKLLVVRPLHRTQIKQQKKNKSHRALNINDAIRPAILV